MCIICLEYEKGKISTLEATRILSEMVDEIEEDHFYEIFELLNDETRKKTLEISNFLPLDE